MSERKTLLKLLDDWGVPYDVYDEPRFLSESAKAVGAASAVGIRSYVDFYFDLSGSFVGSSTQVAESFVQRKEPTR